MTFDSLPDPSAPATPVVRKNFAAPLTFVLLCSVAAGVYTYPQWQSFAHAQWAKLTNQISSEVSIANAEQELIAAANESADTEDAAPTEEAEAENMAQQLQSQQEELMQLKEDFANLNNALSIPDEYAEQAKKITQLETTVVQLKAQIGDLLMREQQYAQPLKDMKAWWLVQQMQSKFNKDENWNTLILQFMGNFTAVTPSEQEALSRMQNWSMQPPLQVNSLLEALKKIEPSLFPSSVNQTESWWDKLKDGLRHVFIIRRVEDGVIDTSTMSDEEIVRIAIDDLRQAHVASALEHVRPLTKKYEVLKPWLEKAQDYLNAEKDLAFLNNVLIGRQLGDMGAVVAPTAEETYTTETAPAEPTPEPAKAPTTTPAADHSL